jgi:hypothetical protein
MFRDSARREHQDASCGRVTGVYRTHAARERGVLRAPKGSDMADLFVVVTVVAFFGLCVALVWGCDRIIGPDHDQVIETTQDDLAAEVVGA